MDTKDDKTPATAAPVPAAKKADPITEPAPNPAPEYDEAVMSKIKGWMYDELTNGPISRDHVCWNALQAALPALAAAFSK